MKIIELGIKSYPKPSGAQGYGGKITMMGSRCGKYGQWTASAKKAIKDFYASVDEPMPTNLDIYGIVYHHHCTDRRAGDVLNLAGSITDVLVKLGIITDDCPKYMPRVAAGVYFSHYAIVKGVKKLVKNTEPSLKIILCETQEDWIQATKPL